MYFLKKLKNDHFIMITKKITKNKKNQVYGRIEDNFRMFTVCSTYPQSNGI